MPITDKNKIKAVIFDWGGVCCKEGEPFASVPLQQILGLNPDEIAAQVRDIYNGYYIGKYDRDSFWRAIINHFKLSETVEINPAALSDAYLNSYELYPDVLDVVLKLQNKYKVGLLSNLTPEMRDNIKQKHDTKKYFPLEMYSCDDQVKSMKPDVNPFKLIIGAMGLCPENCLFIDDSQKNTFAAEQLGMQTILFKDQKQFLSDLSVLF